MAPGCKSPVLGDDRPFCAILGARKSVPWWYRFKPGSHAVTTPASPPITVVVVGVLIVEITVGEITEGGGGKDCRVYATPAGTTSRAEIRPESSAGSLFYFGCNLHLYPPLPDLS
jgi:hypothetical protein